MVPFIKIEDKRLTTPSVKNSKIDGDRSSQFSATVAKYKKGPISVSAFDRETPHNKRNSQVGNYHLLQPRGDYLDQQRQSLPYSDK